MTDTICKKIITYENPTRKLFSGQEVNGDGAAGDP